MSAALHTAEPAVQENAQGVRQGAAREGEREIVFDTETTGLDAHKGDRIIELGAVEVIDRLPTGRHFHTFLDPGPEFTELSAKVTEITGYTIDKVRGAPRFEQVVDDFLAFVGEAPLVAHNAEFDLKFVNAELRRAGREPLPARRFVDTLRLARAAFPGSPATLDALCRRFDVSLAARSTHGALIDSELLAEVYLHLRGGREHVLGLGAADAAPTAPGTRPPARQRPAPLSPPPDAELARHQSWIRAQKSDTGMLWQRLWEREAARRGG